MKIPKKTALSLSIALSLLFPLSYVSADDDDGDDGNKTITISLTNISTVVFTPPILALCRNKIAPIARVGAPASDLLEPLAESGDTSGLAGLFGEHGCSFVAQSTPVLPGETTTVELTGSKKSRLHVASMLLPTNDGFIYTSGHKVKNIKKRVKLRLRSFDAGTEVNDELCGNIPGPQCGGEGFNPERTDHNFVRPHPGIQNVGEVSAAQYNWGEPVAIVRVGSSDDDD